MAHRSIQRITTVLTAATVTDLTNLTDAKLELAIPGSDTSQDSWLNLVIPQITGTIQAYCNRIFANQVYMDLLRIRRPSGALAVQGGADPLALGRMPIAAVSDVFDLTGAPSVAPPAIATPGPTITLAAAMTNNQATMQLSAPLGTAYPFDVLIDTGANQEVATVTGLASGTTYNVTRGAAGTAAVAHKINVPVNQALDPTLYEFEADSGFLTRLDTDGAGNFWPIRWGTGEIVVIYSAGFILPGWSNPPAGYPVMPADIEDAALRLLTMRFKARGRDPMVRSQGEQGIGQVVYWVGATPGQQGSLPPEIQGLVDKYRIRAV